MSLFNPYKPKKKFYPKEPISRLKFFDSSSKSTRATSKNFFAILSPKFWEKVKYHDLYSDLVSNRQINKNSIKKDIQKKIVKISLIIDFIIWINFRKKNKKTNTKSIKVNIVKYFKEDGETVGFPLFKESDIKIDEFDNKVKIESPEHDYAMTMAR